MLLSDLVDVYEFTDYPEIKKLLRYDFKNYNKKCPIFHKFRMVYPNYQNSVLRAKSELLYEYLANKFIEIIGENKDFLGNDDTIL